MPAVHDLLQLILYFIALRFDLICIIPSVHSAVRMDLLILHNPAILNGIRITVSDHHSFEETSQRWRAVGDTGTDLYDLIRIESQTSPTESDVRNNGAYQLSIAFLSSAVKTDLVLLKILAILLN